MLRSAPLALLVSLFASACSVNGTPVGPHFGGSAATPEPDPAIVTIPDVAGLDEPGARAKLTAAGFTNVEVDNNGGLCDGNATPGHACGTQPPAGQQTRGNLVLTLALAPAPDPKHDELVVPDLGGLTLDEAKRAVDQAGFAGGVDAERTNYIHWDAFVPSADCHRDHVCGQSPAPGKRIERYHSISVGIDQSAPAADADLLVVPDLVGMKIRAANQALRAAGFDDPPSMEFTSDCPDDKRICRQDPAAGSRVRRDATVHVKLSSD